MFQSLKAKNFGAVAHLETSQLMRTFDGQVRFSTSKPNVIVGPNGAGKSALMTALSMAVLAYLTGQSSLDENYLRGHGSDNFWSKDDSWRQTEPVFLAGLALESDLGPALYFRPGHIPGNDSQVTAAMMCGYFNEAKAYGQLIKEKSSGQAGQALLARLLSVLQGQAVPKYECINWRGPVEPVELDRRRDIYPGSSAPQANVLRARVHAVSPTAMPAVLMDEPEQSLDALAEMKLWRSIEAVDTSKLQVIVATHSLYPLLHPERFNLIEAVPGYAQSVRSL